MLWFHRSDERASNILSVYVRTCGGHGASSHIETILSVRPDTSSYIEKLQQELQGLKQFVSQFAHQPPDDHFVRPAHLGSNNDALLSAQSFTSRLSWSGKTVSAWGREAWEACARILLKVIKASDESHDGFPTKVVHPGSNSQVSSIACHRMAAAALCSVLPCMMLRQGVSRSCRVLGHVFSRGPLSSSVQASLRAMMANKFVRLAFFKLCLFYFLPPLASTF
jgi:hypothetical protein